jgi:hypothetical protein
MLQRASLHRHAEVSKQPHLPSSKQASIATLLFHATLHIQVKLAPRIVLLCCYIVQGKLCFPCIQFLSGWLLQQCCAAAFYMGGQVEAPVPREVAGLRNVGDMCTLPQQHAWR